jgi:hypothetical protein
MPKFIPNSEITKGRQIEKNLNGTQTGKPATGFQLNVLNVTCNAI